MRTLRAMGKHLGLAAILLAACNPPSALPAQGITCAEGLDEAYACRGTDAARVACREAVRLRLTLPSLLAWDGFWQCVYTSGQPAEAPLCPDERAACLAAK